MVLVPDIPFTSDNRPDQPKHWGSGSYAVLVAATKGFNEISLIGFDLYSKNQKVNNIYKNTNNYSNSDSQTVDPSYWIYQLSRIFKHYPDTSFIIYNEAGWPMPTEWQQKNVRFENILQLVVDL